MTTCLVGKSQKGSRQHQGLKSLLPMLWRIPQMLSSVDTFVAGEIIWIPSRVSAF